ncbi:MAG: MFS transporter [Candidatus Bathyarchaeia archaeon]|jgi:MFS family permease
MVFVGLSFGVFCANIGFLATVTFVPLFARSLGIGMAEIGFIMGMYFIVATIMMVTIGSLSDIGGLRNIIIVIGLAGSAVIYWLIGISTTYPQLLILAGLLAAADSAYRPTSVAVIAQSSSRPTLGRNIGIFNAFIAGGMGVGCLIGGQIADKFGLSSVFTMSALILVVGTLSSMTSLRLDKKNIFRSNSRSGKRINFNLSSMRREYLITSGLLLLCVGIFFRNAGFRGVTSFLPIYLTNLGADNSLIGLIIAFNFAVQIVLMPSMGWLSDRIGRKQILSLGMFATFLATFLLSIVTNPLEVLGIELAVAFSWACLLVASNAFVADISPPEKLGSMMGLVFTSMNLGGVIGPIVAGITSEIFNLKVTFQILSIFPLIAFILSLTLIRESKKESPIVEKKL